MRKCFVLKELILKLTCEKKVELDLKEVAETNHVAVMITPNVLMSTMIYDHRKA